MIILNVPLSISMAPLEPVSEKRQLIYPITIDEHNTRAIYNIGATVSVIRQNCVDYLNLLLSPLKRLLCVLEFSQPGLLLEFVVEPKVVDFAGYHSKWRFVVAQNTPQPIVIRLDLDWAWQLVRIVSSDKLLLLI